MAVLRMTDGLVAKLARCQGLFPAIVKTHTNPAFKGSQYADVADVLAAVRPVLASEGIVVTQITDVSDDTGGVDLITKLMLGDEVMVSRFPLHIANLNPQGVGSLMTYIKRYQLCAILGVHPVGDDDDGNLAATAQAHTEPVESDELADARAEAQEAIAGLTADEKASVATWIRNQKVPSIKKPGASETQLAALLAFIAQLGTEPWPVEGEGVSGSAAAAPLGATSAPSRPEPDAIPFEPVVAGSTRKAVNSSMKAD